MEVIMIIYFSGTGNSRFAARYLAQLSGDEAKSIMDIEAPITTGDTLGIICPVYAWDAPEKLYEFIEKNLLGTHWNYVYAIITCGKNIGLTIHHLKKSLLKVGITLNAGYSLCMPSNYILAGDIPSSEDQAQSLNKALYTLDEIYQNVNREIRDITQVETGKLPSLLTYVIHPLFKKYGRKTKPFHTTDKCIHCGFCEAICPEKTISLKEGIPQWKESCQQCLACIHRCPVRAIEYGNATVKKGRYYLSDATADLYFKSHDDQKEL